VAGIGERDRPCAVRDGIAGKDRSFFRVVEMGDIEAKLDGQSIVEADQPRARRRVRQGRGMEIRREPGIGIVERANGRRGAQFCQLRHFVHR
jgi:hypothetical protein